MSDEESLAAAGPPTGPRGGLRWLALAIVVVSVVYFAATREFPGASRRPQGPPSIVFVLIDTLRADYLGAYGFEGDVSPSLDRVAAEAIVFENAFSQAPWTKPAIASLFTSLHPEQHGVIAHAGRYGDVTGENPKASALPQRAVTLAESLRRAGYETAAFVANPWIQRKLGFAQGFDVFDTEHTGNRVPASALLEKAAAWLEKRKSEKPFFLYLHLMDVHGPYDAPQDDYDALLGSPGLGTPRPLTVAEANGRRRYLMRGGGTHGDDLALDSWRASYAAGVRSADRQLGGFLGQIQRAGVLDDALLVITSDHGEELADHGAWDHGETLFDEQIRIPLLVRMPRGANARRVDRVVSLIDLMPTLLSAAGATPPEAIQGENLGPLLAGGDLASSGVAYASGVKWRPALKAVRTREGKLVQTGPDGRPLVFAIDRDPGEREPLRDPPAAEALEQLLADHVQKLEAGPSFEARAARMDSATRDRLRALGYLDDESSPAENESGKKAPSTHSTQ